MSRPFYAIAHRCTDPADVKHALERGANAVECDVRRYDGDFCVRHDPLPATGETRLTSWLDEVAGHAHTFGEQFALIIFDLKDEGITSDSLDLISRREVFSRIASDLTLREGLAIDEDDDPYRVSQFFEDRNIEHNCYGNGIFALGVGRGVEDSIRAAVTLKRRAGLIKLVYVWTIDDRSRMREYINFGVDGIMTNDVDDLIAVLAENPIRSLIRLATRSEFPFRGIPGVSRRHDEILALIAARKVLNVR
jgi:glycerophosphoryl diester phosphodiesterase